jgi:hypothetical protein
MEFRNSIFTSVIESVRALVQDVRDQHELTREKLLAEIKYALESAPNITGMVSSHRLVIGFKPISTDTTIIDKDIFENEANIVVNYNLSRDVGAVDSVIETKAWPVLDKQVALVTLHWSTSGTTGTPTLDISLDKDPENGTALSGTWLVEDGRIAALEDGQQIDISGIPSPSFALRWTIPTGSDMKVLDTTAELFLVNSSMLVENMADIVLLAAANILRRQALQAKKQGSSDYAASLEETARGYVDEARGRLAAGIAPTVGVDGFGHGYDRKTRANKALGKKGHGIYVEIIGNEIVGKRIRVIPD